MASVPSPRLPGSMTVPPLYGWEDILTVLTVLVVVAVVFFLAAAAGRSVDDRAEWQASLDARSGRRRNPEPDPPDGPDDPHRPGPPA
jgi:hypothetical protein